MQNMTTEGSNNISYNNSNKTNIHYQQHKTSIKLVGDRQTNIATYRAAIAAKNPACSENTNSTDHQLSYLVSRHNTNNHNTNTTKSKRSNYKLPKYKCNKI